MVCKRDSGGRQLDRTAMKTLRMQAVKGARQGRLVAELADTFGVN